MSDPVARYLAHALPTGAGPTTVTLRMCGRIRVGPWLSFTAEQRFEGHAFSWRARAGLGPLRPLVVTDRYRDGVGSMDGHVLGRWRFLHETGPHIDRSAAGRAAVESIWVPGTLRDADWRAESDVTIVATLDLPPERPEVRFDIDAAGAVQRVSTLRWRDGVYRPFGGEILAEGRFGDVVIPARVRVGWDFGTPTCSPFFEATVLAADPSSPHGP